MAFTLPNLPYDYGALEPHIDERTMRIHHDRHHQGYTNKLNNAVEGTEWENRSIEEILENIDQVPEDIRTAVRNNGGGYANHDLFWKVMSPNGGGQPSGEVADAIMGAFGSFDAFKQELTSAASGQFGSGWGWLVVTDGGNLRVHSTPNQDSPHMQGETPILGVDVWEHAYYLHYQNKRGDYLENWWSVVNWNQVEKNYQQAQHEERIPGTLNGSSRVHRIDKFAVPASARDEFLGRVHETHALLRALPGFLDDAVLEQTGGPGEFNFVTIAVWDSAESVENATEAVMARRKETGFDPEELLTRLDIKADFGDYRRIDGEQGTV